MKLQFVYHIILLSFTCSVSAMDTEQAQRKKYLFSAIQHGDVVKVEKITRESLSYKDDIMSEYNYLQTKIAATDNVNEKKLYEMMLPYFPEDIKTVPHQYSIALIRKSNQFNDLKHREEIIKQQKVTKKIDIDPKHQQGIINRQELIKQIAMGVGFCAGSVIVCYGLSSILDHKLM